MSFVGSWDLEWPRILDASLRRGVDPAFIAAIRRTENGGPGREFGVLSTSADSYEAQLRVTTRTVLGHLDEYGRAGSLYGVVLCPGGFHRLQYTALFLQTFARKWAPPGADNDPNGLNANWLSNATRFYGVFGLRAAVGLGPEADG